jgi:hypothetical protein
LDPFIGKWVHLAATHPHPNPDNPNDPNSFAKIYLNGAQVNTGPYNFTYGYDPNILLTIGNSISEAEWPKSPEGFYGCIDEVRIYDRVLEPNEVAYLADPTPEDGNLMRPIPSSVEMYMEEPEGSRIVNFRDFALMTDMWLEEQLWP